MEAADKLCETLGNRRDLMTKKLWEAAEKLCETLGNRRDLLTRKAMGSSREVM